VTVELFGARLTDVGDLPVHRALPTHGRRTIGAWCFLDHFGPVEVGAGRSMEVGPHPHIGLQTVTWLLAGQALHTDSLGNEQMIRPGQVNLMTAGRGIAHAEDGRSQQSGAMEGIQFWVAQPEATRHGPPDFAHHPELPSRSVGQARITVLLGEFDGLSSPARTGSPLLGLDIVGSGDLSLPADARFEYGVVVMHGAVGVGPFMVRPDTLASLGSGHQELHLQLAPDTRLIVLGGEPLDEEIVMWWNFVGRSRDELAQARAEWQAGSERFGVVDSTLPRTPAPVPFWLPGPPEGADTGHPGPSAP
jgi:redox-sensitive bicupin YhaK (pirin superfamily)